MRPLLSLPLPRTDAAKVVSTVAALSAFAGCFGQTPIRFGAVGPFGLERAPRPWDLLSETMARFHVIPCKCLIVRRDTMHGDAPMEVWTEQSGTGRLKLTVLSPLSEQGVTSIDDGHEWVTYRPDENRLFVESSPRVNEVKAARTKIKIARRNYTLTIEPTTVSIAGRRAFCLLASAKHSPMPDRRYCIDSEKTFLLRMEILGDQPKVMLDTKAIEFPASIPDQDFELSPREQTLLRTYSAPITVPIGPSGAAIVGFRPAIPSALPFGFVVDQSQLVHGRKGKFLAVRMTDGLVNATIYEWKANAQPELGDSEYNASTKGLRLRLVGELPEAVITSLIKTFVQQAQKTGAILIGNVKETRSAGWALNCSDQSNRTVESEPVTDGDPSGILAIVVIEIPAEE